MAKTTGIAWCDSTFNPWIGCTRVGPGCDHCYAEQQDARKRWGGETHWGAGVPRYRTSEANWKQPWLWNRYAEHGYLPDGKNLRGGRSPRVFCASLADVFDNEVSDLWRDDLFHLIAETPNLSWLLVTKRIGNVAKMTRGYWDMPNVRLMITICNQEEADRDVPKLLALPCKNGISYEPALGPVDWDGYVCSPGALDGWVIIGGESGTKARPFDIAWAHHTIAQCRAAGVQVFMKQIGSNPVNGAGFRHEWAKHRAGADPAEWPEDLRVREFP